MEDRRSQTLYLIALSKLKGVGDVTARKLIAYCGGSEQVFKMKRSMLEKIPNVGKKIADTVIRQKVLQEAERELEFAVRNKVKVLSFLDDAYPSRLKHCMDAPLILYKKGVADLNAPKMVSVVGTRNATGHGTQFTEQLVEAFAAQQITVVSGLAYGIDVAAHRAALKYGTPTIGCLAHGLDTIYPKLHANVAKEMVNDGALITELPTGSRPDRENFPKRNRIVAGMTDATIVVEAGAKGGALITAELANGYDRDVFAVPGRVNDTYSAGCLRLIKQHKAALITDANDVLRLMNWDLEEKKQPQNNQSRLLLDLSPEQEKVVDALRQKQMMVDQLTLMVQMPMSKVASVLLELEFDGVVKCLPGKVYRLV